MLSLSVKALLELLVGGSGEVLSLKGAFPAYRAQPEDFLQIPPESKGFAKELSNPNRDKFQKKRSGKGERCLICKQIRRDLLERKTSHWGK